MIRALYTAASGMNAQQANIDTVANNLANVNTAGFKKSRMEFQDLVYQPLVERRRQRSEFGLGGADLLGRQSGAARLGQAPRQGAGESGGFGNLLVAPQLRVREGGSSSRGNGHEGQGPGWCRASCQHRRLGQRAREDGQCEGAPAEKCAPGGRLANCLEGRLACATHHQEVRRRISGP